MQLFDHGTLPARWSSTFELYGDEWVNYFVQYQPHGIPHVIKKQEFCSCHVMRDDACSRPIIAR